MFSTQYYDSVLETLGSIRAREADKIQQAGVQMANTIEADGLVHFFGCGHSHLIGCELFYRAGGLAPINPLFEESAMLHAGAVKSSQIERMSGYAELVIEGYVVQKGDTFIVSSSSGINGFPIEMAQSAKDRGAVVIGITSGAYRAQKSRDIHSRHLADVCDFYIDNHVPHGDAVVDIGNEQKAGPLSSICGFFIANSMVLNACEELKNRGIKPPLFTSGNVDGGDESNTGLISKYRGRVKHL